MKRLASDQRQFWTQTANLKRRGAKAALPFAAFTGLLLASDSWITAQVPDKPKLWQRSRDLSDYATLSLAGAAGAALLWGQVTHNQHLRETGWLSGEAAINSTAITWGLKSITQRPRPLASDSSGFFHGGNSFPSEHSAIAWSVASVVAHEYPGPLTKFLAYSLASAVTMTRITGREHFASDAVLGSALGWTMGRQVYRAHHDPELGGGPWGGVEWVRRESRPRPENMASPDVPLDSWVYPAFDRLTALGLVKTAFLNQRPWTRVECARLLEESEDLVPQYDSASSAATPLYRALVEEFSPEIAPRNGGRNRGAALDSVYTRVLVISGPPLQDGFHFAQTVVDDFGRPYAQGINSVSGLSAHAVAGPLAVQVRAEYQQASAAPLYPASAIAAIAQADGNPPFPNSTAAVGRARLLEGLVALQTRNIQFSFGKQSVWFGPGRSGSLLLTNNAEPFLMFRIASVAPYEIPLLSRLLGPAKSEFSLGQLSGHRFVFDGKAVLGPQIDPQPFIHGERISFEPTANLEFGMGVAVLLGGPGLPLTWRNFLRTYYVHAFDIAQNPGKRFSGFDFRYRVPGLRRWLTVYTDSLVVDEFSPIGSSRPSLAPGLYFPQVPKVPNLEVRMEGIKTAQAPHIFFPPGYVYTDRRYHSGYTNGGNLLGSWMGRAGTGGQAWATYHFSPRNRVEFSFRHMEVDHTFLRGGHLNDFAVRNELRLRPELGFSTWVQYERWAFPLLAPRPQANITASFQLTFWPNWSRAAHPQAARTPMPATQPMAGRTP